MLKPMIGVSSLFHSAFASCCIISCGYIQAHIEDGRGPKQSYNVKIKAAALVDLRSLESFVK